MRTISFEISTSTFATLGYSPEEFEREFRLAAAVKWYELGRISQGKAAEIAGLTRSAFIDALSKFKVSPIQITPAEIETEIQNSV